MVGEPEQMGNVLAATFQGEHRWISNGMKGRTVIDAMFFAVNGETVDDQDRECKYKQ
jgi:hypothetical protein